MPQEKEDTGCTDDIHIVKHVVSDNNTSSCSNTEKDESRCDEEKDIILLGADEEKDIIPLGADEEKDNVHLRADEEKDIIPLGADEEKDNVHLRADESSVSSTSFEDMIILDTTAESSQEEIDKCSFEVMPEGMCLDTSGSETSTMKDILNGSESQTPIDVVPSYDADFAGVLTDVEYSMITGKKISDARPRKRCFNCLGDHNLHECLDPPDAAKIVMNRKKYMSTRVSNVRYHEDSENKYGQFQPGKLSENLRHALGLRQHQLPLFIYRMRVLGYPPGWLLDAEVHQADVKMYDGSGKRVSHPDTEEGEAEPTIVKYNPERLVSFPGFNDPVPRGVQDEWQRYNFPPMQSHHQTAEFLQFMNMNKAQAYRKKKLKTTELRSNTRNANATSSSEMEVDETGMNKSAEIVFNPPLPEEPLPPPPPVDLPSLPPEKRCDVEDGEICEDSQASLGDLEAERIKLLKELEDSSSQTSSVEENKGHKDKKSKEIVCGNEEQSGENSEDSRMSGNSAADLRQSENSSDDFNENEKKPKCHHRSHSKGFKLGAIIPESSTPFNTLPSSDKWTVDVSDHINFENLPDALGTWGKMKGVMSKVKKQMLELHTDNE